MKNICQFKNEFQKIPEIKIMIRASNRYKDDINQQISINLNNGKISSKEELIIEIKRQLPIFLEIINQKRKRKNEPKVEEQQAVAAAFLDIKNYKHVEVTHISEIYIPVIKRLVKDSRRKIKELTIWK